MKIMSPTKISTLHYMPGNHMMATFMIGGTSGAKARAVDEGAAMGQRYLSAGYDPAFVDEFVKWYLKSCAVVIKALERGEGFGTQYPEFSMDSKAHLTPMGM